MDQQPAELCLRPKMAVRHSPVNGGVVPLGGLQIVVPLVADIAEVGNADPSRLGEQWDLVGANGAAYVAGPYPPIGKTLGHDAGLVDGLFGLQ